VQLSAMSLYHLSSMLAERHCACTCRTVKIRIGVSASKINVEKVRSSVQLVVSRR
jgi:hypothetical protein